MTALHRVARLLGLVPSRHCAGSYTGWSSLSRVSPAVFDDFSRPRTTPLAQFPMAADLTAFASQEVR
jgi:hypothetical protein